MADIKEEKIPLPNAKIVQLHRGISLQPPLSRRGLGPGLIIINEAFPGFLEQEYPNPGPLTLQQKWAEEGFTVIELRLGAHFDLASYEDLLSRAIAGLDACSSYDGGKIGLLVYAEREWVEVTCTLPRHPRIVAAVGYGRETSWILENCHVPYIYHLASKGRQNEISKGDNTIYEYSQADNASFANPESPNLHPLSESTAHTRNLTFLKKHIGGPYFDLTAIWEEHTKYEFGERAVEKTMGTMVQEPYVNHIPTMTGGIGRERLTNFYRHHFVFSNPDDTAIELVSRTVGIDRVIDEFIFSFTHTMEINWLVPGIPPTGKHVRVPFTSIINIRGDRLYHEHIAWDQASVLRQLGLLPEYLPYPYNLPDGRSPAPGKKFEYRVPAAGVETAMKMMDKDSVPSNEMIGYKIREVDI